MRTIRKNVLAATLLAVLILAVTPAAAAEPIDYGQLGAILGYVVTDYATAVGPGGVLSQQEFAEQKGFLGDALQLAQGLPPQEAQTLALIQAARDGAARAAPADAVVPKIAQALALLEAQHDLGTIPRAAPRFDNGRTLFHAACEDCHAADGSGHTSLKLPTSPPNFKDPKDLGPLSPARVFNAVTYGVPGTAMPAFREAYGDAERWDLAFYVMALGHAGAPKGDAPRASMALSLAELSKSSDDALLAQLAKALPEAKRAPALAALRADAPYAAAAAGAMSLLNGARQLVADSVKAAGKGDFAAARHAAIAAYLDDFEPFEAALRAKDPELTSTLEKTFMDFRTAVEAHASQPSLEAQAGEIERLLQKAEDQVSTASGSVAFVAALAIILREGLESALLLSAMLALAAKSGRARARLSVHLGWSGALVAGGATWFLAGAVIDHGGQSRELTEGITVLVTALLLLGASHWILAQAQAKKLTSFLSQQASLVRGAGWGLGGLAFLGIYREMFEVVVFYRGLLLQSPGQSRAVALGLAAGLVALAAVVALVQRVGKRLKPRPLLVACGGLLCGLAVVMVGEGIRSLQEAAVLGQHLVWFPEVPQLGLFATYEGLGAQLVVVVGLAASLAYSIFRSGAHSAPNASGARA